MPNEQESTELLVPSQELLTQARAFAMEGAKLWEDKLKLVIQPKPRWCPQFVYALAVRLVIRQESDRKVFHENWTRRRRFNLFRPPQGGPPPPLKVLFPKAKP